MWQRRTRFFPLTLIVSGLFISPSLTRGQLNNLPITTTLASTISSGAITDIQSDGFGSYLDGVEAVASFLTTNGYNRIVWGDWQFGALSSTTRKVRLSIANPIQLLQQFITGASFQKKCCSPARLLL